MFGTQLQAAPISHQGIGTVLALGPTINQFWTFILARIIGQSPSLLDKPILQTSSSPCHTGPLSVRVGTLGSAIRNPAKLISVIYGFSQFGPFFAHQFEAVSVLDMAPAGGFGYETINRPAAN